MGSVRDAVGKSAAFWTRDDIGKRELAHDIALHILFDCMYLNPSWTRLV